MEWLEGWGRTRLVLNKNMIFELLTSDICGFIICVLNFLAGKAVAKFCAKYLHEQVLKNEAYLAGDLGDSMKKSFLRLLQSFFF